MNWPEKWLFAGAVLAAPATAAAASETITYSYDALGRLVAVSASGGPNDGMAVSTGYDPAGNRSSYGVAGAGAAGAAAPAAAAGDDSDAAIEGMEADAEPAARAPADEPAAAEATEDEPPPAEEPEGHR